MITYLTNELILKNINPCICCNTCCWSTFCVPGTALSTEGTGVKHIRQNLCVWEAYILEGTGKNKRYKSQRATSRGGGESLSARDAKNEINQA